MRFRSAFAALVLAGCAESPAEPYTPDGPPPAGLVASLEALPRSPGAPLPGGPSVTAAGDSVVVTAVLADNCVDYSVSAGVAGGVLVITVVNSVTPRLCNAIASAGAFRAVAHSAPRGRYPVALRVRVVGPYQAPQELEVLRRVVVLR